MMLSEGDKSSLPERAFAFVETDPAQIPDLAKLIANNPAAREAFDKAMPAIAEVIGNYPSGRDAYTKSPVGQMPELIKHIASEMSDTQRAAWLDQTRAAVGQANPVASFRLWDVLEPAKP
jgi:hypothetical protein